MKLNCIIVDDETLSRNFLTKFCEKSGKAEVKDTFANATDAIAYLKNNEVDLVFLDVEMPAINGFQMLDQLSYMPIVIMTTSKTDYAVTAFEYNVTDFLKKPVEYNRFLDALTKAEEVYKRKQPAQDSQTNIVIKSNGTYVRLDYSDILYVEGMGDYVKYVTPGKTYVTHSTLKAVEDTVSKEYFLKVHRSYIVNVQKINHFTDNNIDINGISVPVSKSNKAELLEKLRMT
jgi:DNA-binding LytR/AlgR family response regulator